MSWNLPYPGLLGTAGDAHMQQQQLQAQVIGPDMSEFLGIFFVSVAPG
ncbi:MAG: hypothetical protein KGL59_08810 [Acidobacteriota bacterium]|nr:hypothetical protein [Acidobacteriota bacterium]